MEPADTIDRLYFKACKKKKSFDQLHNLLQQYPDSAELWYRVGDAAQYLNGYSKDNTFPARCFKVCLQIDPRFAEAYDSLGYWYYALDRHLDSEVCYRKAIEYGAGDMSRYFLSIVYATNGRLVEAYRELDQCVDQEADHIKEARDHFASGFFRDVRFLPVLP